MTAAFLALVGCAGAARTGGPRVPATDAAPFRGAANAPVVIQEFSEFECPFCVRVLPTIDALLERYPNEVRLVWRDYPLPFHPHAQLAAEAAREAFTQQGNDGFWRFHATLFAHQDALERSDLERYADAQGLEMNRFRNALDRHSHAREVQRDVDAANRSGVEMGTPAFFVNGQVLMGAATLREFQQQVERALGR